MRFGLYQKFFLWTILNVALLAVVAILACTAFLFGSSKHVYPPQLFNGDIADIFRVTSAELQFKSPEEQLRVLDTVSAETGLQITLCHFDCLQHQMLELPQAVLEAARDFPRPPYSLCANPEDFVSVDAGITPNIELEAGIIPQQYAIFLREHNNGDARYWYARTILLSAENGSVCYVLLAASSPSITGDGHYFAMSWMVWALLLCLVLSFVWWCPFVHALMQPIVSLTRLTRELAAGNFAALSEKSFDSLRAAGTNRKDELGSLLCATSVMAEKVHQQVHGQRRFLRQIAHELNSPLARLKLGLAVLEARSKEEDILQRVHHLTEETEQLSVLVDDLLNYLRSEAMPELPVKERISVRAMLAGVIQQEQSSADVRLEHGAEYMVLADPVCLRHALGNVIRNAVRYAGNAGPIYIGLQSDAGVLTITVQDCGKGVKQEELPHLTEPFYRGEHARHSSGGSGLGLSIVKHCVEACDGTLVCENVHPKGFQVRICLSEG